MAVFQASKVWHGAIALLGSKFSTAISYVGQVVELLWTSNAPLMIRDINNQIMRNVLYKPFHLKCGQ